jgi:hypothetical protein
MTQPSPAKLPLITSGQGHVGIVMAAYNATATIERSVVSILNQHYQDWTLWIVDDGSTDNATGQLCDRIAAQDPRIQVLHKPNGGTASARNLALQHCQQMTAPACQWIAFLDADDRWHPTYLTQALHTLQAQATPEGIAYSWYYAVDEHDHLVTLSPGYTVTGVAFDEVLAKESLLLPSTVVMHAQVLQVANAFLTEHIHEDREYFLRVCQQVPIYPMGQRLVLYQQSAQGKCRALLKHYDKAVEAEMSIVTSVQHLLSPEATQTLQATQKKNLVCRFLMYNYMQEAKTLWGNAPLSGLTGDKKGLLAAWSLRSGFNLLAFARWCVQTVLFGSIQPVWKYHLNRWMRP